VTQEVPVEFPLSVAGYNSPQDTRLIDDKHKPTNAEHDFIKSVVLKEMASIRTKKDLNKQCSRIIRLCLYINERMSFSGVWSDSAVYENFLCPDGDAFSLVEQTNMLSSIKLIFKPIENAFRAEKDDIRILWACALLEKLVLLNDDATIKPKCFYI
jgi:hypothetical protein